MKAILPLSTNPLQCCGILPTEKKELKRRKFNGRRRLFALQAAILALTCIAVSAAEKRSTWTTDANGLWTESEHWNTPSYPNNADTNLYSATIDMPNRTVTLDTDITLQDLDLGRSILSGSNSPTLLLNGQFHLGPAQLIGSGSLSANGLTVTGATKIVLGWTLENRGIGNWLEGDFRIGNGARLYNSPIAGLNAACDATIVNNLGGTAMLENAGMFRKSAGTNQTKIYVPFLNTGSLEVDSGELAFYGNSTNLGAHIEILPNAALTFTGLRHIVDSNSIVFGQGGMIFDNGTVDYAAATDIKGTVVINLATVNIPPACTVTQLGSSLLFARSGALDLNSGETISWNSMTMSNGMLTGSDSIHTGGGGFQWTGGSLRGSGHFDIDGASTFSGNSKTFRGWTMENHGPMQWSGGDVSTGEGCRFINRYGSSLETSFDGNWLVSSSGGSFFDNFGVVEKTSGTNATMFGVTFDNEGLVEAASGTIRFANSLTNRGALAGLLGTTLSFSSPNIQLTSFGSLDTDGSVVMENGSIYNSGAFRVGGELTLKSGSLHFTNSISAPRFGSAVRIAGVATLDLSTGYKATIASLFQTNGTLTGPDPLAISNEWFCVNGDVSGSGLLELWGNSILSGGSSWSGRHMMNYGQISWEGGDISAGNGLFIENANVGRIDIDGIGRFTGSGNAWLLNHGAFVHGSSGTNQIGIPFVNLSGFVTINFGQLQFNGGFAQTNGVLGINGAAISSTKPLLNYGTAGYIVGSGNIFAPVFNASELIPGGINQIGTLNISANYTQDVTGTLEIELANTNQFDTLTIGGQATLGGKLQISTLNGFVPEDGTVFPILTCAARTGQFAEVVGGDLPNGHKLVPVYNATGVNLVATTGLPLPPLTIERLANTNAVKVSWADGYQHLVLQSTANPRTAIWQDIFASETNNAIVPMTNTTRFFRLRQGP